MDSLGNKVDQIADDVAFAKGDEPAANMQTEKTSEKEQTQRLFFLNKFINTMGSRLQLPLMEPIASLHMAEFRAQDLANLAGHVMQFNEFYDSTLAQRDYPGQFIFNLDLSSRFPPAQPDFYLPNAPLLPSPYEQKVELFFNDGPAAMDAPDFSFDEVPTMFTRLSEEPRMQHVFLPTITKRSARQTRVPKKYLLFADFMNLS